MYPPALEKENALGFSMIKTSPKNTIALMLGLSLGVSSVRCLR
jgi:hypothetical protein